MTWVEIIGLGGLACNIVLTGLALMRACQTKDGVQHINDRMDRADEVRDS